MHNDRTLAHANIHKCRYFLFPRAICRLIVSIFMAFFAVRSFHCDRRRRTRPAVYQLDYLVWRISYSFLLDFFDHLRLLEWIPSDQKALCNNALYLRKLLIFLLVNHYFNKGLLLFFSNVIFRYTVFIGT